jgi:hypothetical protein
MGETSSQIRQTFVLEKTASRQPTNHKEGNMTPKIKQIRLTNRLELAFIHSNRRQVGLGIYTRRHGSGTWRTRHIFAGFTRKPILFIGW